MACVTTSVLDDGDLMTSRTAPSVRLYALEEAEAAAGGARRWVRRDGRSLGDRVLFLGWPMSMAMDAASLGGGAVSSGCAYFVRKVCHAATAIIRYNLEDDSATVVQELPDDHRWNDNALMMWFPPKPFAIAAHNDDDELKERLQAGKNKQTVVPYRTRSIISCPSPRLGRYFRMYVGNLPAWAGSSTLKWFFNNYGEVAHAIVIHDKKSGRSWRFGFVTMTTMEKPDDAIARFEGENFWGHTLRVKFSDERPEGPFVMPLSVPKNMTSPPQTLRIKTHLQQPFVPLFKIYVGNLSWNVDSSRLQQFFSEHGHVVDARVIYDSKTGRSRGFGFVTIAMVKEPAKLVATLGGQILDVLCE